MSSIGPDHPKVKAKVAQKKAARRKQQQDTVVAAFDGPKKIGKHTFHPLNKAGYDAIIRIIEGYRPASAQIPEIIGYVLTIEPQNRIRQTGDMLSVVCEASDWWEKKVSDEEAPEIGKLVGSAFQMMQDPSFFFKKGKR